MEGSRGLRDNLDSTIGGQEGGAVTLVLALILAPVLCAALVALLTSRRTRTLAGVVGLRWARLRGPSEELRAISRALPSAEWDRRNALYGRLADLAERCPDDVAEELAVWPAGSVPPWVRDRVVTAWVGNGARDRFRSTWASLCSVVPMGESGRTDDAGDRDRSFVGVVLAQLRTASPAPGFSTGAVAFLEERLSVTDRPPVATDLNLELLERVLPPGDVGRIGIWQAVLGDAAAVSGLPELASRRWRLAVDAGVAAARPRLAHSYAVQGRELVLSGAPSAGAALYAEAYRLDDDPQYRLGELVALVIEDRVGRAALAAELEQLAPGDDEAALWAGIAHVGAGDQRAGAPLLRRAARGNPGLRRPEVARLAQLAELDTDGLRELGRSLVDAYGREWARHSPFSPDRVVSAAADPAGTDTSLLDGLLAGYPETVQLRRAARERAARAVLTAAVQHAEADVLVPHLELAERLLAEDA